MSETIDVKTNMKDQILLTEAMKRKYGWKVQTVDRISEKKGKRLTVDMYGGSEVEDCILKVDKRDLTLNNKRASYAGLGVVRGPDGNFVFKTDPSNFGMGGDFMGENDQTFKDLQTEYGKVKSEKKFASKAPVTISNWKKVGSKQIKIIEIDEDTLLGIEKPKGMQLI